MTTGLHIGVARIEEEEEDREGDGGSDNDDAGDDGGAMVVVRYPAVVWARARARCNTPLLFAIVG